MKVLFAGLVLLLLISAASSAALTAGNLLVLRVMKTAAPYNRVYVDEITTSGTLVQTFDPNCVVQSAVAGGLSFNQDFTSAGFACFHNDGSPDYNTDRLAVAIQANGTMDNTNLGTLLYLEPNCAFIDGRSVYVGTDSATISYYKRNGGVILSDVVSSPGSTSLDIQMVGTTFYFGGYTNSPYFVASVVGGAPKTIANSQDVITSSNANWPANTQPNRFYVYSATEIYSTQDNGGPIKFTMTSPGQWTSYASTAVFSSIGLYVDTVNNKRIVYVTTFEGQVVAIEDDGTKFLTPATLIKTYSDSFPQDVLYIRAPTVSCSDNSKNQDETDVDCGGYSCDRCADTKSCLIDDDCKSDYCNPNSKCFALGHGSETCQICRPMSAQISTNAVYLTAVPSCQDTFKNQDETDVDCGGNTCTNKCQNSLKCFTNNDCESNYCNPAKKCSAPSCNDGFLNQNETDVDCGGICSWCNNGQKCKIAADCVSQYCNPNGICSEPNCDDGFKNGFETDVDCGGDECIKCAKDATCQADSDCQPSLYCNANVCVDLCPADGIKNGFETDVDCGSQCQKQCVDGKNCSVNGDCVAGLCNVNNTCGSTCNDQKKNGLETDIDCGGDCAPCSQGQMCIQNSDCDTDNCQDSVCVASNTPVSDGPTGSSPSGSGPTGTTPTGRAVSDGTTLIGVIYIAFVAVQILLA